jgi:hypothetical protein
MGPGIMTSKIDTDMCDGCGKNKSIDEMDGNELCGECKLIAETLNRDPERIRRICKLFKLHLDPDVITGTGLVKPKFKELPEVLDAVRFRTRDREMNTWYVSVSEIEGQPVEIFASTAFDRDQHLQSRISNLTTITRLISMVLRHIFLGEVLTLEKTLKQIHRSSRQKNDLPDMLAKVLSKYCKKTGDADASCEQ